MNFRSISRDLWLLTNFRNGWEMVRYLRNPAPINQAILFNGKTIVHPKEKMGLVESLLELWYEQAYFPKGFYSPEPGDVIVDLGANIGLFTLQVARINPICKIAAFEPLPENFSCLSRNIDNFGLSMASIYEYAIGNNYRQDLIANNCVRSLDNQLLKQSNQNIKDMKISQSLPVKVIPLDAIFDMVNVQQISLLKVDIEGGEYEIFQSISRKILKCIKLLAIEYHDHLQPGTFTLIKEKLKSTHDVKFISSDISGCGLLFATRKF